MCVSGVGRCTISEVHCLGRSTWLGWSFGAFAAAEVAFLFETALAPPRALVALDNRVQFPMRARSLVDKSHEYLIRRGVTANALP